MLIKNELMTCERNISFFQMKYSRVKMNGMVVIKVDFRNDRIKRKPSTKKYACGGDSL